MMTALLRGGQRKQAALTDWRRLFAQIAAGDLDVTVLGQLPATQLALGDHLETGALEIGTPLRRARASERVAAGDDRYSPQTHWRWNSRHELDCH
jgi:hypothetical protein